MKRSLFASVLALSLLFFWIASSPVSAEWFNDFYLGYIFPQDQDAVFSTENVKISEKVDFDNAFMLGYRIGYYFEGLPEVGLSIEGSYSEPDPDLASIVNTDMVDTELTLIPVTASLLLRLPLAVTPAFPKGRYQPYLGIGPTLYIARFEVGPYEDTTTTLGFQGKAGLTVMLSHRIGFFLEYRYDSVEDLEFDEHVQYPTFNPPGIATAREQLKVDFTSSSGVIGLSYRF